MVDGASDTFTFLSKDLNPVHEDRDRLEHHMILWKYQYSNHTIAKVKQ